MGNLISCYRYEAWNEAIFFGITIKWIIYVGGCTCTLYVVQLQQYQCCCKSCPYTFSSTKLPVYSLFMQKVQNYSHGLYNDLIPMIKHLISPIQQSFGQIMEELQNQAFWFYKKATCTPECKLLNSFEELRKTTKVEKNLCIEY